MGVPLVAMIYHLTYPTKERNEAEQLAALVPYSELVPVLARTGYSNYLSSEYEGDRTPLVASNQIRRHHLMIRQMREGAAPK
jgi:hypothetical protein